MISDLLTLYNVNTRLFKTLTLHIEENDFLSVAIMILRSDHVFPSVLQFHPVDNERIIVAVISFHEFHGLAELLIVVEPRKCRRGDRDHATREFDALSFVRERTCRFDNESGCRLSPIYKKVILREKKIMKKNCSFSLGTTIPYRSRNRRSCICQSTIS